MPIDQSTARANARRLATLRGLTLKDLAERAGVSASAVYNWQKRGSATELGPKALVSVAEALGVTTEALFSSDLAEQGGAVDKAEARAYTPANAHDDEDARRSTLREIDYLLAGITDPDEQERAADIILAALRAARDDFERRRASKAGPGRAGNSPARGASRSPRRA